MSKRFLGGLFLAGLCTAVIAALLVRTSGSMDADYYYSGAIRIASGQGNSEPYLWNYLNSPRSLPALSFAYWMPVPALVAAAGVMVARSLGFLGARLGLILLAACIPPLTALLAFRLTQKPAHARLAGIFAIFSAFYLPYITTTDAFPIYMVLGAQFFLAAFSGDVLAERHAWMRFFGLGMLAGLMHMTRADGLLWLFGAGLAAWMIFRSRRILSLAPSSARYIPELLRAGAVIVGGYVLVSMPWYVRNIQEWGSLLPPGGARALWITQYEQTMIYPASLLTPGHWLAAGWEEHLNAWVSALANQLQTTVAVQGSIVLFPFILAGLWKLRACPEVRLGGVMWLLTFGAMTVVFPFAGTNGSFFHSGAAVQPLFWAVAPAGLDVVAGWYAHRRRFEKPQRITRFMSGLMLAACVLLSLFLVLKRTATIPAPQITGAAGSPVYPVAEGILVAHGASPGDAVMVNNPPGYWLASSRPAVVVPYGDEQMLLAAARQYHVRYLVLELAGPWQLQNLYTGKAVPPELEYITSVGSTRIYQIHLEGQ